MSETLLPAGQEQINEAAIEQFAKDDGALSFKLEIFEGPLELLLSLITKNKVNIYDIPIALILEQYMEYLHTMEMFNMEIASEFIVMASQLMVIKSRMLLPKVEDEEDPRQELVDMLLEYQRAKQTAEILHDRELTYSGRYEKPAEEIKNISQTEYKLTHDIKILQEAYMRIYQRRLELMEAQANTEKLDNLLKTTRHVPVNERILHVMKLLVRKGNCSFAGLFEKAESRSEIVATFLAVLELIKGRRIMVEGISEDYEDCKITLIRDKEKEELPLVDDGQQTT
ncbi:MAG: segregation/condensation protein A [Clostridia bacterium]|nr:segregation/condensation protein A [Clostridia bacterium]